MRVFLFVFLIPFLGCKQNSGNIEPDTIPTVDNVVEAERKIELPEGAVMADFFGNKDSIYAYVAKIDTTKQTTLVAFEKKFLPEIVIPESIGANLQILKLKNYPNNVLLVNAKLKDTNFNEYYLFVWKDSLWKQAVNRFAIHKSNMADSLIPIINNPKDSTLLLRHYSVFNMDSKSETKFTWKLMQESVPLND